MNSVILINFPGLNKALTPTKKSVLATEMVIGTLFVGAILTGAHLNGVGSWHLLEMGAAGVALITATVLATHKLAKNVEIPHQILQHKSFKGIYPSYASYQKSGTERRAIIYSQEHHTLLLISDNKCMSFKCDKRLRFFSDHLNAYRYNLSNFLSEAIDYMQGITNPERIAFIAKPTGKCDLPTDEELEQIFQNLPAPWNTEQPGLILDKTVRSTFDYINGNDRPDLGEYSNSSVFIHVYYGYGERKLIFNLCTIDEKGSLLPITELAWTGAEMRNFRYPGHSFNSPEEVIRHYLDDTQENLQLTKKLTPPKNVPEEIARHDAYVGCVRISEAQCKFGMPYCIAYSLTWKQFFVLYKGRPWCLTYNEQSGIFRIDYTGFESAHFSEILGNILVES